jgi:hypothetical protein
MATDVDAHRSDGQDRRQRGRTGRRGQDQAATPLGRFWAQVSLESPVNEELITLALRSPPTSDFAVKHLV